MDVKTSAGAKALAVAIHAPCASVARRSRMRWARRVRIRQVATTGQVTGTIAGKGKLGSNATTGQVTGTIAGQGIDARPLPRPQQQRQVHKQKRQVQMHMPSALKQLPSLIRTLQETGVLVLDGMLKIEDVQAARAEADVFLASGNLQDPEQPDARSDRISWMNAGLCRNRGLSRLAAAVDCVTGIARLFDGKLTSGCERVPLRLPELAMLAVYDGHGSRYEPHRDSELGDNGLSLQEQIKFCDENPLSYNARHLTIILYLNDTDWTDADGGQLRCHFNGPNKEDACPLDCCGEQGTCHLDLKPLGGRLVVFQSRELLHEVLPAWRRRWAVSLWVEDGRIPPQDRERWQIAFNKARSKKFVEDLLRQSTSTTP